VLDVANVQGGGPRVLETHVQHVVRGERKRLAAASQAHQDGARLLRVHLHAVDGPVADGGEALARAERRGEGGSPSGHWE